MLDSQGPIPMMTPAQALSSIQMMANHSQNWYDGATTWMENGNSLDDIGDITQKIAELRCDIKEVKENIHAIHEHSLREECKAFEQIDVEALEKKNLTNILKNQG